MDRIVVFPCRSMQGAPGIIRYLFHRFFLPQSCHPTPTLPLPLKGREIVVPLIMKRREIVMPHTLKGRELVIPLALNGREIAMSLLLKRRETV